jgi:pimeloyl-ACP methyl ester carboxylesterase
VLLHGFPEFWRGWINQIERLAQAGFNVVVPDQRGYNLSDKPNGAASYRMSDTTDVTGLVHKDWMAAFWYDWGAGWFGNGPAHPECVQKLAS